MRGPHGGIALLPGYRTNVTGLTADEARALFVLLSGSAHADLGLGQAIGSALRKLMAALPAPYRPDADLASRRILIDPARWRGGPARPAGVDLAVLQQAVFTDRRLRLRYRHGRNNQVRSYTLDPYGLVSKAGVWYLAADHRSEPRLFRTDRALSAAILDEPVRRRAGLELADVWDTLRRVIDDIPAPLLVTVSVRREILGKFLRIHQADLAGPPPADLPPGTGHPPERVQSTCGSPPWAQQKYSWTSAPTPKSSPPPSSARAWHARQPRPPLATPPTRNTGRPQHRETPVSSPTRNGSHLLADQRPQLHQASPLRLSHPRSAACPWLRSDGTGQLPGGQRRRRR